MPGDGLSDAAGRIGAPMVITLCPWCSLGRRISVKVILGAYPGCGDRDGDCDEAGGFAIGCDCLRARVGRGEPKGTIIEIGVAKYRGIVRNAYHNLYSRALRKLRRGLWDFGDETMRAQLCVEQFGAAV